jgi:hypothetical protein
MEGKHMIMYKTLVVGVIVLFISVGVQPAIATGQIEDEAGISQKIRTNIDRLKKLLDTIEKDESKSSKLNPEYKDEFHELYDEITNVNEEFDNIKSHDFPILRFFLEVIWFFLSWYIQILAWILGPPLLLIVLIIFAYIFQGVPP